MPKLVVWLHGTLIDGLGSSMFLCYMEILQSLRRKVCMVTLILYVDYVVASSSSSGLIGVVYEAR